MDQELIQLISRLFSIAGSKGLTVTNPVAVVLEAPSTYENTQVIIRHDEPHNVTAPLNIVWLVADDGSPDYGKILKRSSRIAQAPYTHSWIEVSTYSGVFAPPQVWDTQKPEDQDHNEHRIHIDNPHRTTAEQTGAIPITGGEMQGPLGIRASASVDDYTDDEALPKLHIIPALTSVTTLANTLNSRIGGLQGAINYIINTLLKALGNRVTAVENIVNDDHGPRITAIESFTGADGYVHIQETPQLTWSIPHALDSLEVLVQVFDSNNNMMLPANINIVNGDSVNVIFAIPESGFARIQSLSGV